MKKLRSSVKQRIALGLVCALIVSYTVYHIVTLFDDEYSTYAAGVTTEKTVMSYNGYIFRDEQVLTSSNTGIADYLVEDGTKVAEGQSVAVVYSKGKEKKAYLSRLEEYISILEQSTGKNIENLDYVDQKQNNEDSYDAIIKMLADGETGQLEYSINKFLVGLNSADEIRAEDEAEGTGEITDRVATLQSLYEERNKIFSQSGNGIECSTARPGYFFSQVDGCEEMFTLDAVDGLTVASFNKMVEYASTNSAEADAYGKIGYTSDWKIVMSVNKSDLKHFEVETTYSGLFSENNSVVLPLYLERIVKDGSSEALLIFSCDRLPKNFSFDRCQSVSITVDEVSGIYVPKDIVVKNEGSIGVYILRGSVVHFRHIDIVYEGSDYYLVNAHSEDDGDNKYIRENDMIILTGSNLFDGRILK